jgi:rSAM/selenodomain-associated transferase 2
VFKKQAMSTITGNNFNNPDKKIDYSLIIPTLNEEKIIGEQILGLSRIGQGFEIIIADGSSTDGTQQVAKSLGCRVVESSRGRGPQMNAGAGIASGEVLIFIHADTQMPEGAARLISDTLRDHEVIGGNFRLKFSGDRWESRWLTRLYPLLRLGGMCYGDSGLFIRREIFEQVGGFRAYPIFEDCDIYRRLSKLGRFRTVDGYAVTSSRRFEGRFVRTFLLWVVLQILYWCGVPPSLLGKLYRNIR